ncbi:T9SS type A sorting domain-containing protein [bacterium]|nr:T9SS type A sorting domain-containing protein [bacterium]
MNGRMIPVRRSSLIIVISLIQTMLFAQSQLHVDRGSLIFASGSGGQTGTQTFFIDNTGSGTLNWSINTEQSWLIVMPKSGSGSCTVTVSVDPGVLAAQSYYSDIVVTNTDNPSDQAHISGFLNVLASPEAPFGSFDTPLDGSTVSGSVPFTGWVLDDIGIKSVIIYRISNGNQIAVGQAVLVRGARPDIESNYPGYPMNDKSGWSYSVPTHQLPNGGNGMYTFTVVVRDLDGHSTDLGTKNIICDNANAVKPFGAIDTPAPGGTAHGAAYRISGWALTPQPGRIPEDGSTIDVFVDGVNVGKVTYNVYRQDIASLYPGYANSNGAGGWFDLNTTLYDNGLHSIQWVARDDGGHADGIGSRYFTICNQDMPRPVAQRSRVNFGADLEGNKTPGQWIRISNTGGGSMSLNAREEDWLWWTVESVQSENAGFFKISVNPEGLEDGFHSASFPVYFLDITQVPLDVTLWKADMSAGHYGPFGSFDTPQEGSTVSGSIPVTGWVLDDLAVESVGIYVQPEGGSRVYIGDAVFVEGARPDIASMKYSAPMAEKAGWGYILLTNILPGGGQGTYTLEAMATNISGKQVTLGTKTIVCDNENAVKPFGYISSPRWGETVTGNSLKIAGWAWTLSGHQIPEDGSTINLRLNGVPLVVESDDVRASDWAAFELETSLQSDWSRYYDPVYWETQMNALDFPDGIHSLTYSVGHTSGSEGAEFMAAEEAAEMPLIFVVDNTSPSTDYPVSPDPARPGYFTLYPAYPNPFNPETLIAFDLHCPGAVDLMVYDVLGRRVKTLSNGQMKQAGKHTVRWNGTDDSGNMAASGVYLVRMTLDRGIQTRKMILIR